MDKRRVTAAAVELVVVDPEHEHAAWCLARYTEELNRRSARTFDPSTGATALPHELRPPAGASSWCLTAPQPTGSPSA